MTSPFQPFLPIPLRNAWISSSSFLISFMSLGSAAID
uniref:Uncharacterized protein n=1 Tax=Arundo donax TaxID=35708 RepID=A0A0A8Y3D8_ARUDO